MTHLAVRKSNCAWVEYSMGATQSVSDGDIIKFDASTKRTTGGDGVSYNSTTGVLSLSSTKRYWVQASIAIDRSSNNNYAVRWYQSDGTLLDESDGSFYAVARSVTSISTGAPYINSSHVASLVVDYPAVDYRLEVPTVPASSTVMLLTNLFIIELS